MNSHTLERLEFDRIREMLAEHCNCALGRSLAERVEPMRRPSVISRWMNQVRQMQAEAERIGFPPFGGITDIRQEIRAAVPPAKLEPEQLAEVAQTLGATQHLTRWFGKLAPDSQALSAIGERIGDFGALADKFKAAIDTKGRVRDEASDRLLKIRLSISKAKSQISEVVGKLLKNPSMTRCLQYPNATFHGDRMVLPLKVEYRGRVQGIIHRSSDSGATLFVEPGEAVELNNVIINLKQDEHEEISRILWELTQLVHVNSEEILKTLDAMAVMDLVVGKVKFALRMDAVCPDINEEGILRIQQGRHPLLVTLFEKENEQTDTPRHVVPLDLRLGEDFDMLIVTGPNTGGKTVVLKTAGLLSVMVQAGIPVPVAPGSMFPIFRDILIDVGDEQSLQQSLSTFSSHMSNILNMLKQAGRTTLVLMDELGAGTDPEEGAALGRAIMEDLMYRKVPCIVTTHLSTLKAVGFTQARAYNAAVEFDLESLQPTYNLCIGAPGNSNAIQIAARLGMPKRMVQVARKHLSNKHRMFTEAITGTARSRQLAEQSRREAEEACVKADEAKVDYEEKAQDAEQAKIDFDQWTERIAALKPGDEVRVRRFGRNGVVLRSQLHKQNVLVCVGAIEMEVPIRDIEILPPGDNGPTGGNAKSAQP